MRRLVVTGRELHPDEVLLCPTNHVLTELDQELIKPLTLIHVPRINCHKALGHSGDHYDAHWRVRWKMEQVPEDQVASEYAKLAAQLRELEQTMRHAEDPEIIYSEVD